jgi:hypothetical protein
VGVLPIWSWVVVRLVRSPAFFIVTLVSLGGGLLGSRLHLLPKSEEALIGWGYLAAQVGVVAALLTLSKGAAFLARLPSRPRCAGEFGALTLAAICLQLPILAAALLYGVAPADVGRSVPAILTIDLHLASVALLLLSFVASPALCASLFLAAVALVPALCASDARLAFVAAFLAPVGGGWDLARDASIPALAAAASLALAAHLLRTAPAKGPAS